MDYLAGNVQLVIAIFEIKIKSSIKTLFNKIIPYILWYKPIIIHFPSLKDSLYFYESIVTL